MRSARCLAGSSCTCASVTAMGMIGVVLAIDDVCLFDRTRAHDVAIEHLVSAMPA